MAWRGYIIRFNIICALNNSLIMTSMLHKEILYSWGCLKHCLELKIGSCNIMSMEALFTLGLGDPFVLLGANWHR